MLPRHHWTREDDLVVLYVYRFGIEKLGCTLEDVAQSRGISIGSFRMRLSNFAAIDGKGRLVTYGEISKEVYDQHNKIEEKTLRRLAFPNLREGDLA
jgi:hypothetical protein